MTYVGQPGKQLFALVPQPRTQAERKPPRVRDGKPVRDKHRKLPPGGVDKFLSQTSKPESLEKHEQTDGERWADEIEFGCEFEWDENETADCGLGQEHAEVGPAAEHGNGVQRGAD